MSPPKCICDKYDEDGSLIVYIGEAKPCISCKEREPCFKRYMKYIYDRRYPMIDPLCPYCNTPLHWEQFKEVWFCRTHGIFGDEILGLNKEILPEKQYTQLDLFELWFKWYVNNKDISIGCNDAVNYMIKQIRMNQKTVELRGVKEGWLK